MAAQVRFLPLVEDIAVDLSMPNRPASSAYSAKVRYFIEVYIHIQAEEFKIRKWKINKNKLKNCYYLIRQGEVQDSSG